MVYNYLLFYFFKIHFFSFPYTLFATFQQNVPSTIIQTHKTFNELFYLFLDLTKCIVISKFWDILQDDPTQPRIYLSGPNIDASFILMANNRQSYEFLVENISAAHSLQFEYAVAATIATNYIFTVSNNKSIIAALFLSQNYVMQTCDETPIPQWEVWRQTLLHGKGGLLQIKTFYEALTCCGILGSYSNHIIRIEISEILNVKNLKCLK